MLAIVDYGMANLRSVQKSFERLGQVAQIVSTPEEIRQASHLVVPGVGAFADAIATLRAKHLDGAITEFVATGKPILGICLGLQLLMETGFEDGTHQGLGLIAGDCVRFQVDQAPWNLKVPHMGWNAITWDHPVPLLKDLPQGSHVYFVHSYHVVPRDEKVIACRADYGQPFVAAIARDNLMATQFHPEKSQGVGAKILENFSKM